MLKKFFPIIRPVAIPAFVALAIVYSATLRADGYLNDPYKIVSLVDSKSGDSIARVPTPGIQGPSHEYLFESRPGGRTKHSLFGQTKDYMNGRILDAPYHHMTDDWDINSHTIDLRYRWPLGDTCFIEPHVRCYTQAEADFNSADGSVPGNLLVGNQAGREMYPDLDAVIFQLGYRFGK